MYTNKQTKIIREKTYSSFKERREEFNNYRYEGLDNKNVPLFYAEIVKQFGFKQHSKDKKIAFIVVAHFVHTLPYFLEALETLGDIAVLISKHSGVVKEVRKTISLIYKDIIAENINKDNLREKPQLAFKFLNDLINHNKWQDHHFIILDHGGYFAPCLNNVLTHFKHRIIGIVEHTWNGEIRYKQNFIELFPVPISSIAHSSLKGLESKEVARSINDALTVILGIGLGQNMARIPCILILGYGNMGEHIALDLKQRWDSVDNIYICDLSPAALERAMLVFPKDHITDNKNRFLHQANLIITATSSKVLTKDDFSHLNPGAVIACATSSDDQFADDALEDFNKCLPLETNVEKVQSLMSDLKAVRKQPCMKYQHKNSPQRIFYLVANGDTVNFAIGSTSSPIIHIPLSSICVHVHQLISIAEQSTLPLNSIYELKENVNQIQEIYEKLFGLIFDKSLSTLMSAGFNLPVDNRAKFVGREAKLLEIHSQLQQVESVALTQIRALTGLGGIGKTQLAIHYLHQYRSKYALAIWFNAEKNLQAQFYELAEALQIPTKTTNVNDNDNISRNQILNTENNRPIELIVKDLYKKLNSIHGGTLIVFDNADKGDEVRAFFLPKEKECQSSKIKILITSRERLNWGNEINVELFSKEEAQQYIQKNIQASNEEADNLAERLGGLPLALAQAIAYLQQTPTVNIAKYIEKFNNRKQTLLKYQATDTKEQDSRARLLTTWDLSLNSIKELSPIAVQIIQYAAYLDADNIPIFIFEELCKNAEQDTDETIAILHRFSLIEISRNTQMFSIHRLLQEIVQIQQNQETNVKAINIWINNCDKPEFITNTTLTNTINCVVPYFIYGIDSDNTSDDISKCKLLIPHIERLFLHSRQQEIKAPKLVNLLVNLGQYYVYERREPEISRQYLNEGLKLTDGDVFLERDILNALTFACILKREFKDAKEYCKHTIEKFPKGSLDVTDSIVYLGHIAYFQQQLHDAWQYYLDAQTRLEGKVIRDKKSYSQRLCTINHSLANIYSDQNFTHYSLHIAEKYYLQALNHRNDSVGKLTTLSCITRLYIEQENYVEAANRLQNAKNLAEQLFGNESHPEKAEVFRREGDLYRVQQDNDKAIECYQAAAQMYASLKCENEQASLYMQIGFSHGDLPTARYYLNLASQIYQKQSNIKENLNVEAYLHTLSIYEKKVRVEDTKKFLEIHQQNHTENDILILAKHYMSIAEAWHAKGQYDTTIQYCLKAFEIYHKQLGESHISTLTILPLLIEVYTKQGAYDRVVYYCQLANDLLNGKEKEQESIYTKVNISFAKTLDHLNDNEAIAQHKKVIDIVNPSVHLDGNIVYDMLEHLGEFNYQKYYETTLKYIDILKKIPLKSNVGKVIRTYMSVADWATENNDNLSAFFYYKDALNIYNQQPLLSGKIAAEANLQVFGAIIGLSNLVFDENNSCIFCINDEFTIHFQFDPQAEIFCMCSSVLFGLPKESKRKLRLYETLLNGSMLGEKILGGGVGIDIKRELIIIHKSLSMREATPLVLTEVVVPYIDCVEKWRKQCQLIKEGSLEIIDFIADPITKGIISQKIIYEKMYECYLLLENYLCEEDKEQFLEEYSQHTSNEISLANAELSLLTLGEELNMPNLQFNKKNVCIIEMAFPLFIIFQPNSGILYINTILLEGFPKEPGKRLRLYETLLEGSLLGRKVAGGHVSINNAEQIIFLHCQLNMRYAHSSQLKNFAAQYIKTAKAWRKICQIIINSSPTEIKMDFSGILRELESKSYIDNPKQDSTETEINPIINLPEIPLSKHPSINNNYKETLILEKQIIQPQWIEVTVPDDNSCLFWSCVIGYLFPIRQELETLKKRFGDLFGKGRPLKLIQKELLQNIKTIKDIQRLYQDKEFNRLVRETFREKVADYIANNQDKFMDFFTSEDEFNELVTKIYESNFWGGEIEAHAIGLMLNCRIDGLVQVVGKPENEIAIRLSHVNVLGQQNAPQNHYNVMLSEACFSRQRQELPQSQPILKEKSSVLFFSKKEKKIAKNNYNSLNVQAKNSRQQHYLRVLNAIKKINPLMRADIWLAEHELILFCQSRLKEQTHIYMHTQSWHVNTIKKHRKILFYQSNFPLLPLLEEYLCKIAVKNEDAIMLLPALVQHGHFVGISLQRITIKNGWTFKIGYVNPSSNSPTAVPKKLNEYINYQDNGDKEDLDTPRLTVHGEDHSVFSALSTVLQVTLPKIIDTIMQLTNGEKLLDKNSKSVISSDHVAQLRPLVVGYQHDDIELINFSCKQQVNGCDCGFIVAQNLIDIGSNKSIFTIPSFSKDYQTNAEFIAKTRLAVCDEKLMDKEKVFKMLKRQWCEHLAKALTSIYSDEIQQYCLHEKSELSEQYPRIWSTIHILCMVLKRNNLDNIEKALVSDMIMNYLMSDGLLWRSYVGHTNLRSPLNHFANFCQALLMLTFPEEGDPVYKLNNNLQSFGQKTLVHQKK